jgi:hypothetical protein
MLLQVCRVAQGALRSDRKEQKLQETAERRRAGDKLAVPDPIYLIGRRWAGNRQSWRVLVPRQYQSAHVAYRDSISAQYLLDHGHA